MARIEPGLPNKLADHSDAVALVLNGVDQGEAKAALRQFQRKVLPTLAGQILGPEYWAIDATPAYSSVDESVAGPVLRFDYRDALTSRPDLAQRLLTTLTTFLDGVGLRGAEVCFAPYAPPAVPRARTT